MNSATACAIAILVIWVALPAANTLRANRRSGAPARLPKSWLTDDDIRRGFLFGLWAIGPNQSQQGNARFSIGWRAGRASGFTHLRAMPLFAPSQRELARLQEIAEHESDPAIVDAISRTLTTHRSPNPVPDWLPAI